MYLVKLGGSIITDKSVQCTLREDVLNRLVNEMKVLAGEAFILVHGAGSFGHVKAKRGDVGSGIRIGDSVPSRLMEMMDVQQDVHILNSHVMDSLGSAGVAAISFPPRALGEMKDGELSYFDTRVISRALDTGVVPVSFGDVVLDSVRGFSICSGDEIMYTIANNMPVKRVFFVCDVDGIYDKDPKKNKDAVHFPKLSVTEAEKMLGGSASDSCSGDDVTGAMSGKLFWAVNTAVAGAKIHFVNGMVSGRLEKALAGEDVPQTILEA